MKDTLNARFRAPLKEHYRRRIIVWKDEEGEFADAAAELKLENARILVMQRDHMFELRRQIEVDYVQENLLIYCPLSFAKPQDNWLLDVFLYSEEFRADYWSLLFQELSIADSPDARVYARSIADFFGSKERREKLCALRERYASAAELEIGVLGVLCGAREYGFGEIVRRVLCCDPGEENPCLSAMAKLCGEDAFWRLCEKSFGYAGAHDCDRLTCHILTTAALDGTQTAALSGLPCDAAHATQAYGFFENWLRRDREGLIGICYWVEERFGVEDCLRRMDREALMRMRVFPAADTILLDAALNSFAQGRLNLDDAEELLRARRDQAWSEEYAAYYRALRALTDMQRFHMAHRGGDHATALKELWTAYADEMYRMDQYYREFCVACDQALELMQMALEDSLKAAAETADRMYKNSYLGELNALWTRLVSEQGLDALTGVARQADFYRDRVAPAENRVYVIISDGLRYEVAKTLEERLSGSLRGNTECGAMLGALPGITPVGMAALLPHAYLTMEDDLKIRCDGMATDAANRERVLQSACPESIAVDSASFRRCSREQRAELVRGKKVVYIYHDTIDRVGESGGDVAQACEAAVRELVQLMNLLVNERKASSVLITSDHGFLYSRMALDAYDKADRELISGEILEYKRRYAIVRGLKMDERLIAHEMTDLGRSDLTAVFPRGCMRFRLQGGDEKYFHGGLSLQEWMIPVLCYQNKKAGQKGFRAISRVEVVLLGENRTISNNIFTLSFYQKEPCTDRTQPRTLLAHFEDANGRAISDAHRLVFDSADADNSARVTRVRFRLLGNGYDRRQEYDLVLRDEDEKCELERIPFRIDIVFENDFGF